MNPIVIITGRDYRLPMLKFLLIIPLTEERIFCKLKSYAKRTCAKKCNTQYNPLNLKEEKKS